VGKFIRSKPWYGLYADYVEEHGLTDRAEKRWAYVFARKKYRFLNPKKSSNPYSSALNKLRRPFYVASNWFVATAIIGQFSDVFASKFEKITGISKKHAQDWNTLWSSVDHAVFVYGGANAAVLSGYSEFVSEFGEKSLYFTAPFATFNIGWNVYRLSNRDSKARPALGYGGLITNALMYVRNNYSKIKNDAGFVLEANHPEMFRNDYSINYPLNGFSAKVNGFASLKKKDNLEQIVESEKN
jgi:hypothetical protein